MARTGARRTSIDGPCLPSSGGLTLRVLGGEVGELPGFNDGRCRPVFLEFLWRPFLGGKVPGENAELPNKLAQNQRDFHEVAGDTVAKSFHFQRDRGIKNNIANGGG